MDVPQPQPLFGLLPAGQPLITIPTSQPQPSNFLYAIPYAIPSPADPSNPSNPSNNIILKPFSHLAVFLLPGAVLPPGTAASIYVAMNPGALSGGGGGGDPQFRFLGGVGPGKESAVFKLAPSTAAAETGVVVVGISVEEAGGVAEKMQQLHASSDSGSGSSSTATTTTTMVPRAGTGGQPSTQVLAQRIIQNAFNFLSGFSGTVGAEGIEVVPLKAFQDWWRKFENKVRNDPTFLERDQD